MSQRSLDRAFEACASALSRNPAGLFTDIDGTISHVASTPSGARLAENAAEALAALADSLALTAVVTGRGAEDARRLVESERVMIVGNHGLERITGAERTVHPDAQAQVEEIAQAMAAIERDISGDEIARDLVFENKGLSASIHYRQARERERARNRLLELAEREARARGLRVAEGRLVVELRPSLSVNKGTAVVDLIREARLRGAVYLGDDVTDLDAFASLGSLSSDEFAGVSVAILSAESDPRMQAAADVSVEGVDNCVTLLARLGAYLGNRT